MKENEIYICHCGGFPVLEADDFNQPTEFKIACSDCNDYSQPAKNIFLATESWNDI